MKQVPQLKATERNQIQRAFILSESRSQQEAASALPHALSQSFQIALCSCADA